MFSVLDSYFNNYNSKFCNICKKPCKNNACNYCSELINQLNLNSCKLPSFFYNPKYWMIGNFNNEKIKSLGLFLLQKQFPIDTPDIIILIHKIYNYELNNNIHHFYFSVNQKKFVLKIPNFKNEYSHFISYDGLFMYEEYFNNLEVIK
jgi:hypothetical protein